MRHHVSAGLELTREKSDADRFGNVNPGNADIFNPDENRSGAVNPLATQLNSVEIDTVALYAYDTIELNRHWEITGGVRAEKYSVDIAGRTAAGAATGAFDGFKDSEFSLGGKIGVVFKPVENGSIYTAFGVSALPPGSFLSNPDISRTGDNAFPGFVAGAEGITSYNYQFGITWNFFDDRLSTSAALFRTEKTNVPITGIDPGDAAVSLKGYGEQIVHGLELGVAGDITEQWSVFGGLVLLNSEREHSDYLDAARKRASRGLWRIQYDQRRRTGLYSERFR